jgi:hypothetical protein
MNKIQIVKKQDNADVLVITPLLPDHEISRETKKSIKRNDLKYEWVSSIGNNNIPTNVWYALNEYRRIKRLPKYYIMIDNDIVLGRHMLDRLFTVLRNTDVNIAFTYASFEFKGHINHKFPADPYNLDRLVKANYISSNSMFKTGIVMNTELVMDNQYKRLLDWAFLLKLAKMGYYGTPVPLASFVAKSSETSISAGSNEDYQLKAKRVYHDFIVPLIQNP